MIIKNFNRIILFGLFLITLFPIYFFVLPTVVWQMIYSIVPFIYLLLCCPYNRIVNYIMKNNSWYISVMLLLAGVIYAFVITGFLSGEYSYFEKIVLLFRGIIQFLAIGVFIERNFYGNLLFKFSTYYVYVTVFYVLCSCVFLFDLPLRSVWLTLINENNNTAHAFSLVEQAGEYVTRFGLIGYSGFSCTMICSLGVLLWICFCKRVDIKIWIAMLLILLLGNMFYGRSGLILSLFLVVIFQLHSVEWKSLLKIMFYLVPMLIIIFVILGEFVEGDYITYWMNWVLSPMNAFLAGLEKGEFSLGSSGNVMLNMYFLPDSDWTIMFGDGEYKNSDGSYYGHTDVGLMRMILFGGLFNLICFYGSFVLLLLAIYNTYNNTNRFVLFYISLLACVFFEIKGDALHNYYGLFFAILYIISSMKNTNMNEMRNK